MPRSVRFFRKSAVVMGSGQYRFEVYGLLRRQSQVEVLLDVGEVLDHQLRGAVGIARGKGIHDFAVLLTDA